MLALLPGGPEEVAGLLRIAVMGQHMRDLGGR
jgi:hypothetical protein